ncbi:hypothetical protein NE857_17360 [Nocardiopsis exhalans]|uniref:Uncharacterized protein n=1 Tax=Nocardiopsis exhalans TaxID=163604 RepID=A0ABY5CZA9_9ACTN|nr:hypothetical protein [Nocardiopsis exhalans]USY17129.1 hypothetical protein NE857_17360 [Nocardiopsis exhalans]
MAAPAMSSARASRGHSASHGLRAHTVVLAATTAMAAPNTIRGRGSPRLR